MHVRRNLAAILASSVLVGSMALAQSNDENEIREADKAWSHAVDSKNLDKSVSFYADDASLLPSNAPIANGTEQIRKFWSQLMSKPGFGLTFAPSKIVFSKTHDMAYEIGTFALKLNDPQGMPTGTLGKYIVVWRKQPKHGWKVVADIFNTDK